MSLPCLPTVTLDVKHHLEKKEYYFELMDRLAGFENHEFMHRIEE